jgi:MFS family permease
MQNKPDRLWKPDFIYACIANFLMGFAFYLLIPTLPFFIVEKFNADKPVVGIVLACYVIATLSIRPVSGYLLDSFNRKTIYFLSFIFFAGMFFGYLVAVSLFILIVIRIFHGFSWGIITTSGSTIAIDILPSAKRGEGIGYYGLTTNLSMAVGPLFGLFLYNNYPFIYIFYTSIVTSLMGLLVSTLIKVPVKEKKIHETLSLDRFILVKSIPIGINCMLLAIPYGMILAFSAMYGKEMNVSNTGMFFTYMAVGVGGSRIFSGKLIDRGMIHLISIAGSVILMLSFLLFSLSKSELLYFISAFSIGVGYGTIFPAFLTLFINLAHHNQRGTANSTYLTTFDLGIGLGMIFAGKIADFLNLSYAFGFSALVNFLAIIYYWQISKNVYERNKVE